jgi:IMP dehydrogenase
LSDVAEIEIGLGKSARRGFALSELSIVPNRRTRDPEDVDISWQIDAYRFELPILAAPMDSVMSPATAIELGRLGGLGILNLEGLWTRYEDPPPLYEELAELPEEKATLRLQELYLEPVRPDLVEARLREIRAGGVTTAGAVSPQRAEQLLPAVLRAEPDLLVISGTVVSAEHVSRNREPLNLKQFIRALPVPVMVGGCASYPAALHLMRTGAAGVLVGIGAGRSSTLNRVLGVGAAQATAIADARSARMRHLDETGVYCHVIADGGMATGGDMARAIVCGADAVMVGAPLAGAVEAPGRGFHWPMSAGHPTLPRAARVRVGAVGTLAEVLTGPAHDAGGRLNLAGGLRRAMAMCGYETLKEFQKAEITVSGVARDGA